MTKAPLQELSSIIENSTQFFLENPIGRLYGLARSVIASGLLFTLIFSQTDYLFDKDLFALHPSAGWTDDINYFKLFGFENLVFAKMLAIALLGFIVIGFLPRVTGLLHWWLAFSFNNAASIVDGGDQVAAVLALLILPVTLLDGRTNHFSKPLDIQTYSRIVSNVFLRVLIPLQMSFIYFHAAIEKLYKVEEWRNGTAVYYFAQDPIFGSSFMSELSGTYLVLLMTWGTIALEIILGAALFMVYRHKSLLLLLGIGFHLSISMSFGLFSFMCSMVGGLFIYLLNPAKQYFDEGDRIKIQNEELIHG